MPKGHWAFDISQIFVGMHPTVQQAAVAMAVHATGAGAACAPLASIIGHIIAEQTGNPVTFTGAIVASFQTHSRFAPA